MNGGIWIGTLKGGLYRTVLNSKKELDFFRIRPSNPDSNTSDTYSVTDIQCVDKELIWFSTSSGIKQINTETGSFVELPLLNTYVNTFCVERDIALWVVIAEKLFRYNLKSHTMTEISSLPKGVSVIELYKEELWFSSFDEFYRIQKDGGNLQQILP